MPASQQDENVLVLVSFIGIALLVAGLVEALPNRILALFPQSVLVLIIFLIMGAIGLTADEGSGIGPFVNDLVVAFESIPEGFQLIFLPPLIFSELFKTNVHVFITVIGPILLLAFPAMLLTVGLTALFPVYILSPGWSWYEALAFGGMLSATDPVAVIAILEKLGASKKLSAIISGESLFNDGVAIVVVTLFLDLQAGTYFSTSDIVGFIFLEVLGSMALGVAFGIVLLAIFPLLDNNSTPLVALTLSVPYLCYAAALAGGMSGVLSIIPLGLMSNAFGRAVIVGDVAERMEHFWNQAEFIANSLLFAISGIYISDDLIRGPITGEDWGYLVLLYIFISAARFVSIGVFLPLMNLCGGYGVTLKESAVMWHGALRGAVGLTLAITIRSSPGVSAEVGSLITFYMGGIVAMTLIINAPSCTPLVKALKLQTEPDQHILREISKKLMDVAAHSLVFAGGDKALVEEVLYEPQGIATDSANNQTSKESMRASTREATVREKRRHFLLAQSVTYNKLVDRHLITHAAWFMLIQSIDSELDKRDSEIDQWAGIIKSPFARLWLSAIGGGPTEQQLFSALTDSDGQVPGSFTSQRTQRQEEKQKLKPKGKNMRNHLGDRALLTFGYLAYGYLRANQISRSAVDLLQSKDDLLSSERAQVIQESLAACIAPANFLNALRTLRPDILQRIKTSQVVIAIRYDMYDRCLEMADLGLLEESELHNLLHVSDKVCNRAHDIDLPLRAAEDFSNSGDFEKNEDLYPFGAMEYLARKELRETPVDTSESSAHLSLATTTAIASQDVAIEDVAIETNAAAATTDSIDASARQQATQAPTLGTALETQPLNSEEESFGLNPLLNSSQRTVDIDRRILKNTTKGKVWR